MFTNSRFTSALTISGLLALVGLGCSVEERTCPRVAGEFVALYAPIQTTCAPLATVFKVPFDSGKRGVQETNVNQGYQSIKTEIEATGCTLSMTQSIIKKTGDGEMLEQRIRGGTLSVDAKDRVTGVIELTRFDENQMVACMGTYTAEFTQTTPTSSDTAGSTFGN